MRLTVWLASRLLRLLLVLLSVAAVSFGLMMLSPIDPVDAYLGPQMAQVSPEQRVLIAEQWGFDAPPAAQFNHWLRQLLSGELGWSHIYNQPVSDVINQRFQRSFFLLLSAWLLSLILGVVLGITAGSKEGSWLDRLISGYAYITASTPAFWLAMLALLLFSVTLGWTPTCCA
ncbi:MAG TPA: ABC transporter permease, partial [Halomonas sp.]|nr:ABC transporter permease [Halomonas sp.]